MQFVSRFFSVSPFVTQGQAEDYYFYKGPKGELVISNKELPPGTKIIKRVPGTTDRETPQAQEPAKPPPGSKIIKQLPGLTDKEASQTQAQEPGKTPPTAQAEGSPRPTKDK